MSVLTIVGVDEVSNVVNMEANPLKKMAIH